MQLWRQPFRLVVAVETPQPLGRESQGKRFPFTQPGCPGHGSIFLNLGLMSFHYPSGCMPAPDCSYNQAGIGLNSSHQCRREPHILFLSPFPPKRHNFLIKVLLQTRSPSRLFQNLKVPLWLFILFELILPLLWDTGNDAMTHSTVVSDLPTASLPSSSC